MATSFCTGNICRGPSTFVACISNAIITVISCCDLNHGGVGICGIRNLPGTICDGIICAGGATTCVPAQIDGRTATSITAQESASNLRASTTSFIAISTSKQPGPVDTSATTPSHPSHPILTGAKAGIAVGALFVIAILCFIAFAVA